MRPVTIVIDADTIDAIRNLKAFVDNADAGFKKAAASAAAAGVKADEFAVKASTSLRRAADAVARVRAQQVQFINGLTADAMGTGRGVGNWFTAGGAQFETISRGLQTVGRSAGNTRLVFLQLGSSIQAVTSSAIMGLSPMRALAVQAPELVQMGLLAGVSFKTMASGLVALTPLLVTGAFALRAYTARLEETRTAADLLAQTQRLIARNTEALNTARERELISDRDFELISALLKLGTREGLAGAQEEMRRLGITDKQLEAADKFRKLIEQARDAALGTSIEAEEIRVLNEHKARIEEIQKLIKQNPALKPQEAEAIAAINAERDAKLASLRIQVNKKIEADVLKRLDAEVAEFQMQNADRVFGKAQRQFEMEASAYGELRRQNIIDDARYNELWDAANLKRIEGIRKETEFRKRAEQTFAEMRAAFQAKIVGGMEGEIAEIEARYDRELQKIRELNLEKEKQIELEKLLELARGQEILAARTNHEKEQTRIVQEEERKRVMQKRQAEDAIISIMGSSAAAARLLGKEGFLAWKAISLAQAIISGAVAVNRALADGGPYAGPFLAAAAAAAAAVQIATIAATQPGYEEGGYTGDGDRREIAGVVHRGEYVMPAEQTRRFRPELEAMHRGTLPAMTVSGGSRLSTLNLAPTASGGATAGRVTSNVAVHVLMDPTVIAANIRDNPDIQHAIVDVMRRQSRIFHRR